MAVKRFKLFAGKNRVSGGAASEAVDPLSSAEAPRSRRKVRELRVEIGENEKHLLECKLTFPLLLKLDGEEVTRQFEYARHAGIEIYETTVGTQEMLRIRLEREPGTLLPSKVRLFVNGRLQQVFRGQRQPPTVRSLTFQTLLPCLFLFLLMYYALVYRPEVVQFYCGRLWNARQQERPPAKPHAFSSEKQNAMVWRR
jgi:hypothetical protein